MKNFLPGNKVSSWDLGSGMHRRNSLLGPGSWHQVGLVFLWVMSLQFVNALGSALALSLGEVTTVDKWSWHLPPLHPLWLSFRIINKNQQIKKHFEFPCYFTYTLFKNQICQNVKLIIENSCAYQDLLSGCLFFFDPCRCDLNFCAAWASPGCAKFCTDHLCNTGFTKETRVLPYLNTFLYQ